MNFEILDIINIITITPLFLYSGFLFFSSRVNHKSNVFLSLFLFTNGFYLLNFLFIRLRAQIPFDLTYLFYIGSSFSFVFGPSLYFYTKSIADKNFQLRKIDFAHFAPFFISIIYYLIGIEGIRLEYYGVKYFQIIIYFFPIFIIIKEYQSNIKDYFSAIEKLNLKRLVIIYVVFVILWGIDVSDYFTILIFGERNAVIGTYSIYASLIINFIFANLFLLFSLTHHDIPVESNVKNIKYETSYLSLPLKEEFAIKLKRVLEEEKIFLKSDLTLNDLSSHIGISTRNLSQIINEVFQKNFYDLINSYRIEESKILLANSIKSKTILEILYEVGFNSKSAFNTAFKKNTGITPTEYRTNSSIV